MAITPDAIANAFSGFGGQATASIFQGIYYFLIIAAVFAVMGAIYYYISFPIRVTVFPLYGSSRDGYFSVGKPKVNKVKWIKHRTAWRKMRPVMNSKEIEPFDSEFIYPGGQVYAFELNGEWIPGRVNIDKDEETLRAEINPVPYYIRNWQSLQHKKHAIEFAGNSFWDENKALFVGLIVSVCCLVAVCITAYLTYQHINSMVPVLKDLTSAVRDSGNIPGIPGTPVH